MHNKNVASFWELILFYRRQFISMIQNSENILIPVHDGCPE